MLAAGVVAATTAAKWLMAAKIMTTVGAGMTTVHGLCEKRKHDKKRTV